ncbi:sodium hydrogen exchanger family protein [Lasius niger]|uniref:Sodium hydrogen exchanger family protein n=1 Tax=Lasius niger TaxID=67767 RepID=A0A0J7JTV4_LASNI|nr:sodium hydrogen exchanger family protein [Lasius niger]
MRISASATGGLSSVAEDPFDLAASKIPADTATRIKFETATGSTTIEELLHYAMIETNPEGSKTPSLVVVGRRSGINMEEGKLYHKTREELRSCLGALAGHIVAGGVRADLLVVQSKRLVEASRN